MIGIFLGECKYNTIGSDVSSLIFHQDELRSLNKLLQGASAHRLDVLTQTCVVRISHEPTSGNRMDIRRDDKGKTNALFPRLPNTLGLEV